MQTTNSRLGRTSSLYWFASFFLSIPVGLTFSIRDESILAAPTALGHISGMSAAIHVTISRVATFPAGRHSDGLLTGCEDHMYAYCLQHATWCNAARPLLPVTVKSDERSHGYVLLRSRRFSAATLFLPSKYRKPVAAVTSPRLSIYNP